MSIFESTRTKGIFARIKRFAAAKSSSRDARVRVHDEQNEVDVPRRLLRRALHKRVQVGFRLIQPRRIRKDDLIVRLRENAQNPVPRRLRFGRNDGNLLPDQYVDERAFSRVRPADDRNDTRFHTSSSPRRASTRFSSARISRLSSSVM